jgi:hypothetical protein
MKEQKPFSGNPENVEKYDFDAKCRHLKKTYKETLRQEFICSEAQNPINTPPRTHFIHEYSIHTGKWEGGGWRVEPERRGEGQQFTELSRKYQHD